MQDRLAGPHVNVGRSIAKARQVRRQLPRAFFIGAVREPKEEVVFRLADIAAVHGSRRLDGERIRKQAQHRLPNRFHLAFAAGRAGARKHRSPGREQGGVFDKGRVRKTKICVQHSQSQAALLERLAIAAVLSAHPVEYWSAKVCRSQSSIKVTSGYADNRLAERQTSPLSGIISTVPVLTAAGQVITGSVRAAYHSAGSRDRCFSL